MPMALPATQHAYAPAPNGLRLALLGPVGIERDGEPLSFRYDKVQALLVYLTVENQRSHHRASLAALLWPEQDEQAARHSLSQALFSLRRTIDEDPANPLLLTSRDSVGINPNSTIWLDVAEFQQLITPGSATTQRLAAASDLYCGDFLEGFHSGDSLGFEEWMLLTRERLRQQACEALRQLSAAGSGVGLAHVCDYARRWIALDPLNEEAHRRLMQALADYGQRNAALAQFERCRELLHEELGIEPEAATLALYEALKQADAAPPPRPIAAMRERLPLPTTRLIGREREEAALAALLADPTNRLITISGPGGVGKTRLALQVAAASAAAFADGVCWVPLASVRDPLLLPVALAQALGIHQKNSLPAADALCNALAPRHMLLLLDNCEHLLPALATLATELLAAAPQLTILATSRVVLRLSHERRYQLAPLGLAAGDTRAMPPAVALFVERAQAVRPDLQLDMAAIAAICQRLDGLPLAIELAAMRTRLLSPRELLARLNQRLPLLRGGSRDLPQHQQALHAAIDWSYRLLSPSQQALLRRLAVFAGGWVVAAAEAVCADELEDEAEMLDDMAALLDASLITQSSGAAGEPRCAMLETIREFALEQLVYHGAQAETERRHASSMVKLAAEAKGHLLGAGQRQWLLRLDDELDNLRTALGWCVQHNPGAGLRLATDIERFWQIRGYWREAQTWLESLLAEAAAAHTTPPTAEERAAGLVIVGMVSGMLNDFALATMRLEESRALFAELGDQDNVGRVFNILGTVALRQGHYGKAEAHYRQSLALRRTLNHRRGIASALHNLAESLRLQGRLDEAGPCYDESVRLYRELDDMVWAAAAMRDWATLLTQQGDHGQARSLCEASHRIAREYGYKPGEMKALNGMGRIARNEQQHAQATAHYRQSLALALELDLADGQVPALQGLAALAGHAGQAERAAALLAVV
ncbi:MAG: tetratricopeptide repeat protein, partial [Chloroflexaceae bacterium]|nr:tetratricopeptide repeat protein [Chloroflexaceae bacterium]